MRKVRHDSPTYCRVGERPKMKSFCTGSRVYGIIHKNSDTDLVVYVDDLTTYNLLRDRSKEIQHNHGEHKGYDFDNGASLRYGDLNLIVCYKDLVRYESFRVGTQVLYQCRPVTRDQAIKLLSAIRTEYKKYSAHFADGHSLREYEFYSSVAYWVNWFRNNVLGGDK